MSLTVALQLQRPKEQIRYRACVTPGDKRSAPPSKPPATSTLPLGTIVVVWSQRPSCKLPTRTPGVRSIVVNLCRGKAQGALPGLQARQNVVHFGNDG